MKTKKGGYSPKLEEFLSPKSSEDQKKVQKSSSAQMQTIVKLLRGCSQIIKGIYPPPPQVSAPLVTKCIERQGAPISRDAF